MKLTCPQCGKSVPRPAIILVKQIGCPDCGFLIPLDGSKQVTQSSGGAAAPVHVPTAAPTRSESRPQQTTPTSKVGVCRKCKTFNPGESRNCSKCGASLYEVCLICNGENRIGSQVCGVCGADLGKLRQLEGIPKLRNDRRYVKLLAILHELGVDAGLPAEIEEARAEGLQATAEAEAAAARAEQAVAATQYAKALPEYEQALRLCTDFQPAIAGLARTKHAIQKAKGLRVGLTVAACVVALAVAAVFGIPAFKRWQDESAWKAVIAATQSAAEDYEKAAELCRNYMRTFPNGRYAEEAKRQIQVVLPQKIEERDWKHTQEQITSLGDQHDRVIALCQEYISKHSFGRYNAEAKRLIDECRGKTEERDWVVVREKVEAAGSDVAQGLKLLDDYIRKHPSRKSEAEAFKQNFVNRQFETAMKEGEQAEARKERDKALVAYNRALQIKPDSREARQAKERMMAAERQQQFDAAMREGERAEAKQDWDNALAEYEKALNVDQNSSVAKEAAKRVKSKKLEARLTELEPQVEAAIAKKDWVAAREKILEIRRLDAAKGDRGLKRVDELEFDAKYQPLIAGAKLAEGKGDWPSARKAYEEALRLKPGDREAEDGFNRAKAKEEGRVPVIFSYYDPEARSVNLAGEFNGWNKTATPMKNHESGVWRVTVPLKPGDCAYSFFVNNSQRVSDPANSARKSIDGVENSLVSIAADGVAVYTLDPPTLIKHCCRASQAPSGAIIDTAVDRQVFEQKYKSNTVRYAGTVEAVDAAKGSIVFKGAGNWPWNWKVEAVFRPDKRAGVAAILKGQNLTVEGVLLDVILPPMDIPVPFTKVGPARTIRLGNAAVVE